PSTTNATGRSCATSRRPVRSWRTENILNISNLTKQYGRGEVALRDVSLEVPPGQVMALIGPSGAGKSTLIRCINRLVEPTNGSISLGGQELTTLRSK